MTITAFDTLKFARRLKDAGVPERQAEAEAEAIQDAFSEALDTQVPTKADIAKLEIGIKGDISRLETKVTLTQWMIGLVIAVQVLPLLKGLL